MLLPQNHLNVSEQDDDLFAYASKTADALAVRGVVVTESDSAMDIDMRTLGDIEVIGTETGAYVRFKSGRGDVRIILAPSAFFALQDTFRRL
jgi:hypothetical protein